MRGGGEAIGVVGGSSVDMVAVEWRCGVAVLGNCVLDQVTGASSAQLEASAAFSERGFNIRTTEDTTRSSSPSKNDIATWTWT